MTASSPGPARQATAAAASGATAIEPDPERPGCHFRPPSGWMNDPNGTLWHHGRYHLFYQHNPYGDTWGDIHWGHARSPDLVRWEHLPVALAPSLPLGEAHCFTGSAWRRPDGTPLLIYSSFPGAEADRPAEQWAVVCDDALRTFDKWEGNPVLSLADHGGPALEGDWRDPFVFSEGGRVFLILGATEKATGAPVIPLYEARDSRLLNWTYRGLLHRGDPGEYRFYECPNLVPLGDRHLLVYSAHRPVEWVLGDFDPDAGSFDPEAAGRLDRSASFYATGRVAHAPGGETVLVGWVRGWEAGRGWNGCLGLPRRLGAGPDGLPRQEPVPAVAKLRTGEAVDRSGVTLESESTALEGMTAPALEVRARLEPADAGSCGLRLRGVEKNDETGSEARAGDREPLAEIRLRPRESLLEVAGRSRPLDLRIDAPPVAADRRPRRLVTRVPVRPDPGGGVDLTVFWDRSVLEVFVQDGDEVCTRVMATDRGLSRVQAFAEKGRVRFHELRAWELEPIW